MKARPNLNRPSYIFLVWLLVLINLVVISRWLADVSPVLAVSVFVVGVTGTLVLTLWSHPWKRKSLPEWIPATVKRAMEYFRPVAEEALNAMIIEKTKPVIETAKGDLADNTGWLCESGQRFAREVLDGLNEIKKRLFWSPGVSLSDELFQLQKNVEERIVIISDFIDNMDVFAARILDEMDVAVSRHLKEIIARLDNHQKIALKYLEELLYSQLEEWDGQEEKPVPQVDRMRWQFEVFMEPSVNHAVERLQADLHSAVHDLTSKMVGRLQREALSQVNAIKQLATQMERLLSYSRGPREKLTDALELLRQMEEDINDVMMTLAWQDIVLDKKWSKTKQELLEEAEALILELSEEQRTHVDQRLESLLSIEDEKRWRREIPQVFSLLTAAEKNYLDFENERLSQQDLIKNVLQWCALVDEVASRAVSVSSDVLSYRRVVRGQIREGKYDEVFEAVKEALSAETPGLAGYVSGLYPSGFYAFCLSARIGYQPHKPFHAAWMLYLGMLFEGKKPEEERDTCLLIGLLLVSNVLRDRYLRVTDGEYTGDVDVEDDLRNIREAGLRIVKLLSGSKIL